MTIKKIKTLSVFIFFVIQCFECFSQNQWTFLSGYLDSSIPNFNSYNAVGQLSPLNKPSSREHCGSGILNNKIWIFGGEGNGAGSDVWFYDINAKAWAFVSDRGSSENYVDKNIESQTAHPGNRSRMASSMDLKGNLWVFGGETKDLGYHTAWNDFWKYNTRNNKWTWLGGSTGHSADGSYNNTSAPDWPRARYRARGWFDEDGNYWIFGGVYYNGHNAPFPLNDMWKYNVKTNIWTCETGDCNLPQMPNTPGGVYPNTYPSTSTSYKPRGRSDYNYWVDNDGNFWFYGGFCGEIHSGAYSLWDTWKYNPKTREWTLLTLEGAPSGTSPGWSAEALCWLGNDGLPWMKLVNRSIWKFKNGHWENQRYESYDTWAPPVLINNQAFVAHPLNQPGSHYTTFNHIKTDSAVYLFNGSGLGTNNVAGYTGALWKYSLEMFPTPKLDLKISKDDFLPNGSSPYTASHREITIENIGQDTAKNVVINMGLGPSNSFSAMHKDSIKVFDITNSQISNLNMTYTPYLKPDTTTYLACGFDSTTFKSSFKINIPKVAPGNKIKIIAQAQHCMANTEQTTIIGYSWNHWGANITYKNNVGKKYSLETLENNSAQTLESYSWSEYKAPMPTLKDTTGSQLFTFEIGSGVLGNPSNFQNLGSNFPYAQARIDLTLPQNVFLANGSLADIKGEYAVNNGASLQLFNVNASTIDFDFSKPSGNQSYIIKFPASQYLPIRRIIVKLRANTYPVNLSAIKTLTRTTFNYLYANLNYGWKPASP
jgi:Galactose oxidase, central domain